MDVRSTLKKERLPSFSVLESHSKKGFGNGFLSKVDRFDLFNYQEYLKPGPASY